MRACRLFNVDTPDYLGGLQICKKIDYFAEQDAN